MVLWLEGTLTVFSHEWTDMAIPNFNAPIKRRRVGFVDEIPPEFVKPLIERGYDPYLVTASKPLNDIELETIGSFVLTQNSKSLQGIHKVLRSYAWTLDHDCRIYVRYADDENSNGKNILLHVLGSLKLPASGFREDERHYLQEPQGDENVPAYAPFVHIVELPKDGISLANTINANPPGPPPNKYLRIEVTNSNGEPISLNCDQKSLLQRAFWDCDRIQLIAKTDGLSPVDAYECFAHHSRHIIAENWPFRVMVKIGPRRDVAREYYKYRNIFLEKVPFHLGPRLRLERCALGRSCGIIVSDYVENAQLLRDVSRKGRGAQAIASLFNITLVAWHRSTEKNSNLKLNEFLVEKALRNRDLPPFRLARMGNFGVTSTLNQLIQQVLEADVGEKVLTGMVHGDLHATNVLVRMNDAVIIDLERIEQGWPVLFDAASLEAGLFIDGFIRDKRSPKAILASISRLYDAREAFDHNDYYFKPDDPSAWFYECAWQIRMQATQMELYKYQYAWVLAIVFIKKACQVTNFADGQDVDFESIPANDNVGREGIRQLAYLIAEKIVFSLGRKG